MPRYRYQANNDAGETRQAVLTAPSIGAAATLLAARGLSIQSITLDHRQLGEAEAPLSMAVEQLMASRGELFEPLTAYATEYATGRRRQELKSISTQLKEGEHETVLAAAGGDPSAWSAVLAAAAEGDDSSSPFARFLDREAPTRTLRWRRSLAMAYPLVIAMLCLAIVWPISLFVLPTFEAIIGDFGLAIPWSTSLVLSIGCFLASGGAFLVLGLIVFVTLLWITHPWWAPRRFRRWILRRGLLGRANRSLTKARIATHAANLVEAGLPAAPSLSIIDDLAMSDPASNHRAAAQDAIAYAASVDLDAATQTRLLRALATNYSEASAAAEQWAMGLSGPVTIVVLGVVIGSTVIALFLPLVTLINGIS